MVDRLFDIVVIILFALIILWGAKIEKTEKKEEICSRLNSLRGVFALEIIVGHVIRYDQTWLYPLGKFMIISVAFFFFVSAFGMILSYQKKGVLYFEGFLRKKAGYLLVLAIVIFMINSLWDVLIPYDMGYVTTETNLFKHFFETTNWYIWEQILFYILFYFVYKYVPKYRVLLITILTLVGSSLFFQFGWLQGWYSSAIAFPLGLLYGEYFEKCQIFLKSWCGKLMTVILSVAGLCSLLLSADSIVGMVYLRNIMCGAALMILLYFCMHFRCQNGVIRFLGKYSTELYLSQFIFLEIASVLGLEYKERMMFVFLTTVIMSLLLHPIIKMLKRHLLNSYR